MTSRRLLAGVGRSALDLHRHRQVYGEPGTTPQDELLAELGASGLRGRGGAAFPLATKLSAVRVAKGEPILLVNGCEGEPMSTKDRLLLSCLPHLVIDGALTLARAIGAGEVIFAVDEFDLRTGDSLQTALDERADIVAAGLQASLNWVPAGYVTGQESALVQWCNGGPPTPMAARPRVTERGVRRRPTLVSNAETLAHAAVVDRRGATWFRAAGTDEEPGTALITVSGAVSRPGVVEVELGAPLTEVLDAAGWLSEEVPAFLIGGYAGGWVDSRHVEQIRLSQRALAHLGVRLGAGIVVALGADACPVAESARVAGWLATQSAGQCGPCVDGLAAIARGLERIRSGAGDRRTLADVARWCDDVAGRGACSLPDGAVTFTASALRVFAEDFHDHARHGECDACGAPPTLLTPGVAVTDAR
jgi:NADH:ubiquinone oxidoreductase subunit F (NADH-binding)